MAYFHNSSDINQTFIIESVLMTGSSPTLSACTLLYSNALSSCSGDTTIFMGSGVISFDGNIYTNDSLTADAISGTTFYSGGSNLINIIQDVNITGATFNSNNETLTLYKPNGEITVSGFANYYTTGSTLIGSTVYFDRNDQLSAYTLDLGSFSADTYTTGLTFNENQLIITRNDGVSLNAFINVFSGLTINGHLQVDVISATTISATTFYGDGSNLTGISIQDTMVTGGTYSDGSVVFTNNTGGTFSVSGFSTGYTLATSAITQTLGYVPLSAYTDTWVTGGTLNNGTVVFTNNTGGTFSINGFANEFTGGTVNELTATTISSTTYLGLPKDIYVTGGTYTAGTATFTNNTGGTFSVSGFSVSPILWTIELIEALSVDVYAPYNLSIDTTSNILNSPTITIYDDGVLYTLGTTIAIGSKITITASVAGVTNLNITKI